MDRIYIYILILQGTGTGLWVPNGTREGAERKR